MKKNFGNIKSSYYVFLISPNNASITNGYVVNNVYKSIIENSACKNIYYVIQKKSLPKQNIKPYFNEILKIPFTEEISANLFLSTDSADYYNELGGDKLSKLLYVYNGKVIYDKEFKFTNRHELRFPYDLVEITRPEKTLVKSDKYLHTNVNSFYPIGNDLLQLSDVNGRVGILNSSSGELDYVLDKSSLNAVDLYAKYVTKSKKKIDFARKEASWFEKNNRPDLPVYTAYVSEANIYIYFAIQVTEELKNDLRIPTGEGQILEVKKGEPIANSYGFVMKCDRKLNVQKVYYFEDPKGKFSKVLWADPSTVFMVENEIMYLFNEGEVNISSKLMKSKYYNKGVSKFLLEDDGSIKYEGLMEAPLVENFEKKSNHLIDGAFLRADENIYVHYHTSPYIYNLNDTSYVGKLTGLGNKDKKEQYRDNFVDSVKTYFNWNYYTCGKILNNQYYAFVYENEGVRILEIMDLRFNPIQKIKIDYMPNAERLNYMLVGDNIFVYVLEENNYYLYKYKLLMNDR